MISVWRSQGNPRVRRIPSAGLVTLAVLLTMAVGPARESPAAAAYPVTTDSFIQQQKLNTPNGASNFGGAIAISGDTILVGASSSMVAGRAQGLAYVFVRSGSTWTQQAELAPADGATVQEFGVSVALAGNTAVVGAPREDVNGKVDQGAVYVFVRNGTTWTQQQRLVGLDGNLDDAFGRSVSIDGNTVAIGSAESDGVGTADQGAAYIFERVGTTWTQQQKLTAADGQSSDIFGSSISLNANTVIVGAFADDIGSNVDQGSAYVFTRTNGTWTLQQKLVSSDGQADDAFGFSVAISGDRAFIGAPTDDLGGFTDRGTASVFVRSGSAWFLEQQLAANDGRAADRFGQRVAVLGDQAVVGATSHDDGAAYVFRRTAGSWTQGETLTPSDRTSRFGVVALDGSTIAVGSPEVGRVLGPGSAYVFTDQPVVTPPPPAGPPAPPLVDAPSVTGSTVRITWGAVSGAMRYSLRAGTAPGGNNAFDGDVGNTTSLTAVNVPTGSYFVRVHSANALGESVASNEVRVDVGGASPCVVLPNPTGLFATVSGSLVTLTWVSVPGPTSYLVEAGSVSGAANLAVIDTGNVSPILMATAPPGTYFVRVRAKNACGLSAPSNQVVVVVN